MRAPNSTPAGREEGREGGREEGREGVREVEHGARN